MLLWFIATAGSMTSSIPINSPQTVDFSTIDTLVGAVIAIAAMIVVGLILFKYNVIRLGGIPDGTSYGSEISIENRMRERTEVKLELNGAFAGFKESIDNIRKDLKEYTKEHQECQRNLPEKYVQWDTLNRILDELKKDRKERWEKFDQHTHDDHSGVVVMRRVA